MPLRTVKRWTHTFQKRGFSELFALNQSFSKFDTNESLRKECSKRLWRGREMKMLSEAICSGHFFPRTPFLELDSCMQIKN